MKVFIRTAYNYDMNQVSDETGLKCEDDSLAVQSERDEVDINTIVRRFGLTGELPTDLKMPQSGDFTNLPDFHGAMNMVRHANEQFLKVPAEIRARFGNDPQAFMHYVEHPDNIEEVRKMGLAKPLPIKEPPVPPKDPGVSGA